MSCYQGAKLCKDIAAGKYDSKLQSIASYLAKYPNVKYLIRPDYEVSQNMHANTDPSAYNQNTWDKTAYPAAFKHVRSVINAAVKNAQYVYHPVRGCGPDLYPGDDATDFIGFSIFNNDVCMPVGSTGNCAGQTLDVNVVKNLQWAPKPKLIAESAVQAPAAASGADFVTYLTHVKSLIEKYDIAGWTYINSNWPTHGWPADTWGDSRVEHKPQALAWWKQNIGTGGRYTFGK